MLPGWRRATGTPVRHTPQVRAFLEGVVAGYGIAIPVGPITLLIFDTALRRGFASALPASAGAASADLIYAGAAAIVGVALAELLEPYADPLRYVGAGVLLAIAGYRLRQLFNPKEATRADVQRSFLQTYLSFLGLTLTNPLTVTYFAALILALQGDTLAGGVAKVLFVTGAFLASLSWQVLLAGVGALLHRRLPARALLATGIAGNVLIVLLAVRLGA
jgi:threonine/homoserine/homoserine lactone efflux protein